MPLSSAFLQDLRDQKKAIKIHLSSIFLIALSIVFFFPFLFQQNAFTEMNVFIACQMFYKIFCIKFICGVLKLCSLVSKS